MKKKFRYIFAGFLSLTFWTNNLWAINQPPQAGDNRGYWEKFKFAMSGGKLGTPPPSPGPIILQNQVIPATVRSVDDSCGFTPLGSHAITDWLNTINIGSSFDYSGKYALCHSECFAFLNSEENITVWIEPYGFYSHYRSGDKDKEKIDFTLASIAAGLGGKFSITDEINLNGTAGYFHSRTAGKKDSEAKVNGVYFGPAVEYLFRDGSVGLTLLGIGNFYQGHRKICFSNNTDETSDYHAHSWDIDVRLDSEYTLEPPSDFVIQNLTIHPFVRVDYLNVFELGHRDKIVDKISIDVASRHTSYFYSKLGAKFERVMICNDSGILTSSLDLGWINMSPLAGSPINWKVKELSQDGSFSGKPEVKNQFALGVGLIGMYYNGLLASLEYSAALGADSPMQSGRIRFEWNW